MANRGQKRTETGEELPADKRACSSLEFRPSSSNSSSIQTHLHSPNSTPGADMDTSSSASASSRSDGEHEKEEDSAYGSCDSDDAEQQPRHRILRDYQRRRSSSDHGKLNNILSNLSKEGNGGSDQLATLTELCEVLSFCNEDSLSGLMADSLSPILVKLAKNESNANILLLAIRGITYLCDVFPRSSGFLVRHDAVPALCQRLLAIEYVDVAEQCLQALEKISRDQPLACLQAGAIMAVLNFIDFFSISVQRVALSTVVNICKKLPSEGPAPFIEAVPKLCDLLQHEDQQLVESVATCLIKISERTCLSSELLDELCKHELINQVMQLINLNSRTTISQPIYNGLVGLLVKLSSGSFAAFRSLYELNISSTLKDVLSTYDLSHGMSSPRLVDGNCNQVHEVLKLLNEMLPTSGGDQGNQVGLDKESFLADQPDLLQKFGMDILPTLVQVVNSGANIYVCYGCLSVISKLVFLSKSDMLVELLKTANIPSFLAGAFTRKDHHLLMLALQIAEMILQKLSDVFLNSFIKEGVFFAIDALLMPEKCSQVMLPVFSGIQPSFDSSQKSSAREVQQCLCYAFDTVPSSSVPSCKLDKDTVGNLAKHIKANYFAPELFDSDKGMTDILQHLRTFSTALNNLINMPLAGEAPAQHDENFYSILHQIMLKLNGREPVSTFEFIESGIVKSLMHYLSNGLYLRDNVAFNGIYDHLPVLGERFEAFAKLFLSYSDIPLEDLPLSVLIQKLQSALSSLENFPVIPSHGFKQKTSFATVPNGRCVMYPCFRVCFVRGEGETCLSDCSEDVLTVDPFCSSDAIEGYLWPKILTKGTENGESDAEALEQMESQPIFLPSNTNSSQGKSSGFIDSMSTDLPEIQENETNLSEFPSEQLQFRESNSGETMSLGETNMGSAGQERQFPAESTAKLKTKCSASSDNDIEDSSPRLLLYLEGHQVDRTLTLYQVILQQLLNSENEFITWEKLWTRVYTVTYVKAVEPKQDDPQEHKFLEQKSSPNKIIAYLNNTAFFSSMFACKLAPVLDKSSPTYDILFLLKSLEGINKCSFHLMSSERIRAFAEGRIDNLDNLKVMVYSVPQNEFVSSRLTEKLEQQMRDTFTLSTGGMPPWCNELIASCPFLFSFEARCKYFRLAAFGPRRVQHHALSRSNSGASNDRQPTAGGLPRKKFLVWRDRILDSATRLMDLHAGHKGLLEVEYNEEVGTGLGPTLEFYTLVSLEFQKSGLGMWREDHSPFITSNSLPAADSGILINPFGLFPRPWSPTSDSYNGIQFSEVLKKFVLLGQIVARAIQDGRVLDVPFSKAFYKLILGQDLSLYDIQSFDPELGRTVLEFQAIVNRQMHLKSICVENSTSTLDLCFRNTRIEDLCLDFTLPGYPDYVLSSDCNHKMVNSTNLDDYIKLVVDATIHTGISRQVEAFKSGFNQVFAIKHLHIFTEELERLLCGERDFLAFNELLEHIKFDHGYTASSPPIINLLEIIQEFEYAQRRAFLQFVTGAPRLPPGGLASLNPKLTIVRKHSSNCADTELPSVMTCANYLKLPPYSSKERMKEKLLYAITEGQGSFHLS